MSHATQKSYKEVTALINVVSDVITNDSHFYFSSHQTGRKIKNLSLHCSSIIKISDYNTQTSIKIVFVRIFSCLRFVLYLTLSLCSLRVFAHCMVRSTSELKFFNFVYIYRAIPLFSQNLHSWLNFNR